MPIVLAASVDNTSILLSLFIVLISAKVMAEVFERLGQPAVAGEIIAGVLIGPSVFGWVQTGEVISVLAEIGVIFLLFTVGLETRPQAILKVGRRAFLVGSLGVVLPFIAGYLIALWWNASFPEAMFIGAALVATSVGITARVLSGMGLIGSDTARIVLGAAVIDDILGLLILSLVSSVSSGKVEIGALAKTGIAAILFILFVTVVGYRIINRLTPLLNSLKVNKPYFNIGLILCLGLSFAANYIGIAAIIGAFLAGMTLSEAAENEPRIYDLTAGVTEFLVPLFLVNIGMQFDPKLLAQGPVIGLAIVLTIAAVITKFIGGGLGAWGLSGRQMAQVGAGMIPRGEVGIVVAQIGAGLGIISPIFFASVLFMTIATTVIAPPIIKIFYAGAGKREESFANTADNDGDISVEDDIDPDDLARLG